MKELTFFPITRKGGGRGFIAKSGDNTYFCSDESLTEGDEVLIEASKEAGFFFAKRAASGITVRIKET